MRLSQSRCPVDSTTLARLSELNTPWLMLLDTCPSSQSAGSFQPYRINAGSSITRVGPPIRPSRPSASAEALESTRHESRGRDIRLGPEPSSRSLHLESRDRRLAVMCLCKKGRSRLSWPYTTTACQLLRPYYIVKTTRNSAFPLIIRAYASFTFCCEYFSIIGRTPVSSANRSISSESVGIPEAHP